MARRTIKTTRLERDGPPRLPINSYFCFRESSPKKDFFKKKEVKKSSPRKSGDSAKFKSAEFVESSDESSSEEEKVGTLFQFHLSVSRKLNTPGWHYSLVYCSLRFREENVSSFRQIYIFSVIQLTFAFSAPLESCDIAVILKLAPNVYYND